jgi:hypothetical protein
MCKAAFYNLAVEVMKNVKVKEVVFQPYLTLHFATVISISTHTLPYNHGQLTKILGTF